MGTLLKTLLLFLFINQFKAAEWCINRPSIPFAQFLGIGTYKSSEIGTDKTICSTECSAKQYSFSAVWKQTYCFCFNDLTITTNATKQDSCVADDGLFVSGSVSSDSTTLYEIKVTSSSLVAGPSSISIQPTVYINTGGGPPPDLSYSYEDRKYIWETSSASSTPLQRIFNAPGVYEARSLAMKGGTQIKISEQKVQLIAYQSVTGLTLKCNPLGLIYMLVDCVVTMATGTQVSGTLSANNVVVETITLSDTSWERAGSVPMFFNLNFLPAKSPAGIHVVNSIFHYNGVVTAIEVHALKAVLIDILLLKPSCPTLYCVATAACDTNPSCSRKLTCSPDYCPLTLSCSNNCNNRLLKSENLTSLTQSYVIEQKFPYTLPKIGYQIVTLTAPWSVKPGYRLAFHTMSDADVIATTPVQSGEATNFYSNSHTTGIGSTVNPVTPDYVIHQFSAISQPQRLIKLKLRFNATGAQSISVTLQSLDKIPVTETSSTLIGLPINDTSFLNISVALTNVSFEIKMNPHTGDQLQYYWTMGDTKVMNTSIRSLTYTYTKSGVYNVSVTVYNSATSKTGTIQIKVRDPVKISSFTGPPGSNANVLVPLTLTMTSGNDFSCTLSGQGITNVTQTSANLVFNPKWLDDGSYTVRVDCYNEISSDFKTLSVTIMSNISGLAFPILGGPIKVPYQLKFTWLTGSAITFEMVFDNITKTTTKDEATRTGLAESMTINGMGVYIAALRARNNLSDVILVANLTYAERISGAKLISSKTNVNNGSTVSFDVQLSTGSAVQVIMSYPDGTNTSYQSSLYSSWVNNYTTTFTFNMVGNFNITANVSNVLSYEVLWVMVYVITGLGTYDVNAVNSANLAIQLSLNRTSGPPASMTNITIDWKDGTFTNVMYADFKESEIYTHVYNAAGLYTATITMQNPVSNVTLNKAFDVINAISNFKSSMNPKNTWNGNPVTITTSFDKGDNVLLTFVPGDTGAPLTQNFKYIALPQTHDFSYTYNAVGNYSWTVTACNKLGCANFSDYTQIQYKVNQQDFQVVTNGNIEYLKTNSTATISFTGTNFPTGLQANLAYSDGSPPTVLFLSKTDMPATNSKNITITGTGTLTVTLSNLASSITLTSQYGVFEKFTGFDVSVTWGATRSPGLGPQLNTFPLGQPSYFRPNPQGKGTVVEYTFSYSPITNTSAVTTINATMVKGEFPYTFNSVGTYKVTLKVTNPLDSAQKDVEMVIENTVKDIIINAEPYPLRPKYFGVIRVTIPIISPDSCICVNLGNGSKIIYGATSGCANCSGHTFTNLKPVDNEIKMIVLYSQPGNYEVNVTIYTATERLFAKQYVAVANIVCALPVVVMTVTEFQNPRTPQKGIRGSQNLLSGEITDLPCAVTKKNDKLWSAVLVDATTFETVQNIDLTSIMTKNITQLIVPPLFLPYGLYKFTFTVTMNRNETIYIFQSSSYTYLEIGQSPIVVNILNGGVTLITKSITGTICFTPEKFSSDPDLKKQNFSNWKWEWMCQQVTEAENKANFVNAKPENFDFKSPKTGCFGDGPGIVNFTSSPCFYGGNMDLSITYMFTLKGTATYLRDGFSKLKMMVVKGSPPDIDVQCIRPDMCRINKEGKYAYNEMAFNPSDQLMLNASCTMANGSACSYGIWSLQLQFSGAQDFTPLDYSTTGKYVKGINSQQMAVLDILYSDYPNLERIQLCYTSSGMETNGMSCIQFYILPLPKGIVCRLDKTSILQTDMVCVNCTYQKQLQYRYYVEANETMTTLGFDEDGHFCSIIPYRESNTKYFVQVTNSNGGFIKVYSGEISIQKMNESAISSLLAGLINGTDLALELAIAKGDFKNISQIYLKYVSVLTVANQNLMKAYTNNSKSNLGATGYGSGLLGNGTLSYDTLSPAVQAEYQLQRDKKSSIIETMTAGLNAMVPADIKGLHLVSSVVTSITDSFDVMNRKSQWDMSNKLLHLAKNLKEYQGTGTRDDINTIASNLLSATYENDAASNIQINNGINRDIKFSKDNYLDYDTNLESPKKSFMDLADPLSASNSLTKETNSDFQSKIALGVGVNSESTIDTITKVIRDVTVIDDVPINITTNFMQYYAQKTTLDKLSNKNFSKGRSNIILPDICSLLKDKVANCSDPNMPVGLEIIATPNNVRSYIPESNTKGLPIPMTSDFLSVNLYLGNQANEAPQKPNGTANFTIFIGRDPVFAIQDFNMSEPNPKIEPPLVIPGTGTPLSGPLCFEQKLVMYKFQLNGTDQSIHFQLKADFTKCTQYLVVGRLAKPPILSTSPDGTVDPVNFTFWGMIPTHTKYCNMEAKEDEPDPFTFFVNNYMFKQAKADVLRTEPGYSKINDTIFFGVRELTAPEFNTYTSDNRPPVPYPYSGQINTTFRTRIYSTGCYFNSDNFKTAWRTTGCVVGSLTTPKRTQCICNHLSTFASGWVVAPNSIDFNYVFSNFDFTKNLTLFVTEIVICVVFILVFLLARRQDIKDLEKIGVTPLASNDPDDMYLYELVVDTSIRQNAGTSSNVYFILSGETDETNSIPLVDKKRPILKRGNVDRFLLAVPRPLGTLQYIRLWHDNSGKGKNASWFCNYFGVTDLQTKEKFHFLVNNWFAVEEKDGKIDRLIAVASVVELMNFKQVFARKMKLNLSEDHLWISVMARPPESRFTRVERVACCLLLLFLTMLTTCMFYQQEGPSKKTDNSLKIGPFALSFREVWIGLISNIIGFVPLFLVIELFRKSELKHGHANKLRRAVEDHMQMSLETSSKGRKDYETSQATLIRNEETDNYRAETPNYRSTDQINLQISDAEMDNPQVNTDELRGKKVTKQKLLPWWTRIISWGILSTALLVSMVFVTFYGIQFGDIACKKWISAMFISFFTSVLFTQPIKVVLLAAFFSLIFKKSKRLANIEFVDEEEELMDELGKRNELNQNEEYLHDDLYTAKVKPQKVTVQPPPKEELEKAREVRLQEMQMYDVFREILFYLVFFCTLVFVTYSFRDPNAYNLKNELSRVFITPPNPNWQFLSITNEEQFWTWALNVLVPAIRAPVWYNNDPQLYQRGFISNRNNRLMGYAIIRQVRTKKDSCKIYPEVKHFVRHCYSSYNSFNQDEGNYARRWRTIRANQTAHPAFTFRTQKSMNGIPYIGRIGVYPGGGYVYELRSNVTNLFHEILELKNSRWINVQTRAIFVEFTTYNPNINLFAINTFVLELPGTGGMWPKYRVEPANLLGLYSGGVKAFEIFTQVLYGILILMIIVKEIRNISRQKSKYFTEFWNYCELFIIGGSFAAVAGFVYVRMATNELTAEFAKYGGDVYLNFNNVAFWNENLGYLTSFLVFVSTLKFIRVLRFNRRIGMLGSVIQYSGKDMKQFCIIFAIVFLAFVMVFYSLFMDSLYRYHTFLFATEASMQIALGKFEFLELYQKEPIFGPIVFACYVLFIIFVLLNMFIAILNEGFAVVKADIEKQGNDHELLEFIMKKFLLWTGISNTKLGKRFFKTEITDQIYKDFDSRLLSNKVDEFPEKVQQLLNHINRIIHDSKTGDRNKEKQFSSIGFEKSKPVVKGSDDGFEVSRPTTASSNIVRPKESSRMTPLD